MIPLCSKPLHMAIIRDNRMLDTAGEVVTVWQEFKEASQPANWVGVVSGVDVRTFMHARKRASQVLRKHLEDQEDEFHRFVPMRLELLEDGAIEFPVRLCPCPSPKSACCCSAAIQPVTCGRICWHW